MTRIVIDSNVVVAAMRSKKGWSHRLVYALGIDPRWQPCISGPLLQEYTEQVFGHACIPGWTRKECDDFLNYICASCQWVQVHFLWRPLLPDEDDHMVLEAAIAASANFIITFNKQDFEPAKSFGIQMLTPREFMLSLDP